VEHSASPSHWLLLLGHVFQYEQYLGLSTLRQTLVLLELPCLIQYRAAGRFLNVPWGVNVTSVWFTYVAECKAQLKGTKGSIVEGIRALW